MSKRGVGEALLQWIDQRAQQALAHAPAGVPVSIEHIYVYAQNRAAQQRLEKFGYARERIFHRMAIDIRCAAARAAAAGRASPSDRSGAAKKIAQCMRPLKKRRPTSGDTKRLPYDKWRYYFIEVEENFDPEAWFLAVEGETIVGYALCRWDRAGEPDRSTVRYLAVRRAVAQARHRAGLAARGLRRHVSARQARRGSGRRRDESTPGPIGCMCAPECIARLRRCAIKSVARCVMREK